MKNIYSEEFFFGREICTLLKHKEKCRVDRTMEDSGARKKVDYVS